MAGNIRWTDGGNTITLSPILGYESPYRRRESVNVTLSGKTFVHLWSQKLNESVPLINVSAANRTPRAISCLTEKGPSISLLTS